MSEKTTKIGSYIVPISYCIETVEQGIPTENIKDVDVEIQMLRRASVEHTKFATKLFDSANTQTMEETEPIARRFVELTVIDDKVREVLLKDSMACIDIYFSELAQQDIERFLAHWGVIQRMMQSPEDRPEATTNND